MADLLLQNLIDGVLTLTFNRPDKKNALNVQMWIDLREAFLQAQQNDNINVVVLAGNGADFCAGVDLNDFGEADGEHPFESAARVICDFDKPLIGVAQGLAIGGGATILFHCDVVYVGESLRLRLPFANLGLVPEFASSYMLQANIGARKAAELFYTAEWIDADKALDVGIATAKYADDELLAKAAAKAAEIAQWPVNALRETKRCLKAAHNDGIDRALAIEHEGMKKQAGSPENIEAVMAFIEKRPADFKKLLK
jgi:enoyl-CoA hydratase/carnithine racemase